MTAHARCRARPRRGRPAVLRARTGFTIAELLVAVLLLAVGVLGLASTATVVSRTMGESAQQAVAATVARSRFERLRSANWSCANFRTDSAITRGMKEVWTVTTVNARAVSVSLTVTYSARRRDNARRTYKRTNTYRSTVLCN